MVGMGTGVWYSAEGHVLANDMSHERLLGGWCALIGSVQPLQLQGELFGIFEHICSVTKLSNDPMKKTLHVSNCTVFKDEGSKDVAVYNGGCDASR